MTSRKASAVLGVMASLEKKAGRMKYANANIGRSPRLSLRVASSLLYYPPGDIIRGLMPPTMGDALA